MMGHVFGIGAEVFLPLKALLKVFFLSVIWTDKERAEAEAEQVRLADMGCRVLAVARRNF